MRRYRRNSVTTIELTSKRLKAKQVYSILFVILGAALAYFSFDVDDSEKSNVLGVIGGVLIVVFGLIMYLVVKVQIWWHHK